MVRRSGVPLAGSADLHHPDRAATDTVAAIHHRMPVILDADERDAWLSGADAPELGATARLRTYAVARFGLHDDGPDLIEPGDP
ncbi:SOS response-associated peptidase family protein [Paracoccus hibiscisoli]|uniref:SOS response-associated peptidase family protein n=1 Tax=Paracoccus hibiscisoli TaxID=2023261 RepID=UPI0023F37A9C|nr:SOS response-associated peptidase family protein [Paracoccus hibiscisoli]